MSKSISELIEAQQRAEFWDRFWDRFDLVLYTTVELIALLGLVYLTLILLSAPTPQPS
ncbi:MAG: hypothetical protein ABJL99_10020 [Aliishimia sp.]